LGNLNSSGEEKIQNKGKEEDRASGGRRANLSSQKKLRFGVSGDQPKYVQKKKTGARTDPPGASTKKRRSRNDLLKDAQKTGKPRSRNRRFGKVIRNEKRGSNGEMTDNDLYNNRKKDRRGSKPSWTPMREGAKKSKEKNLIEKFRRMGGP